MGSDDITECNSHTHTCGRQKLLSTAFKSQLFRVSWFHTAITNGFLPLLLLTPGSPVLGPLPQPLLRAHHSLILLLCPLQPLLLPLLPADEDACGSHRGSDDGRDDAPDDATRGPCACCVGGLCKKRDSVKGSPGGSHSSLFLAPLPKSPPTCLPSLPRAGDILILN